MSSIVPECDLCANRKAVLLSDRWCAKERAPKKNLLNDTIRRWRLSVFFVLSFFVFTRIWSKVFADRNSHLMGIKMIALPAPFSTQTLELDI